MHSKWDSTDGYDVTDTASAILTISEANLFMFLLRRDGEQCN